MRISQVVLLALLAAPSLGGCSSKPSTDPAGPGAGTDVEAVPVPAELVGKWRLERKDGASTRTVEYHISAVGHIEVDAHVKTPEREFRDRVKSAVTRVEGDKLSVTDISHTDADGVEDVLSPDRRRPRMVQFRVTGNELHFKRE